MTKIFISYRRADSQYQADRLHAHLKRAVADADERIFIDIDNIPLGVDFHEHLDSKVGQCDVLLALIGPTWIDARDPVIGQRRLDDPADFVRIEIASALQRGIPVVPVLLDGTPPPRADQLPEDLRALARRQAVEVRRLSFDADCERLIRRLGLTPAEDDAAVTRVQKKSHARASRLLPMALGVGVLVAGGGGAWIGIVDPFGWRAEDDAASQALGRREIDRISKTVVRIVVLRGGRETAAGSGTLVAATGLIHTNQHVVENGEDFLIELLDDPNEKPARKYRARLAGFSTEVDLALLQIDRDADGDAIDTDELELPFMSADAADVQRGDRIFVFGYPALEDGYQSSTSGMVTSVRNDELDGRRLPVWYQTDAQISPGSSGGLVVDEQGEIVGIPTAVRTEEETGGRSAAILSIGAVRAAIAGSLERSSTISGPTTRTSSPATEPADNDDALDYRLEPSYGLVSLSAGFPSDPHSIDLKSGGAVDVGYLSPESCMGFATSEPNYRVTWDGASNALRIFFVAADYAADGDTTLVVNTPSNEWLCNDDAVEGSGDPLVAVERPAAGQYDIWVGSYTSGRKIDGTLYVTEKPLAPADRTAKELNYDRTPFNGVIALEAGFAPDPRRSDIVIGGGVDASYLGGACKGFTTVAPDLRLEWKGGTDELGISFHSDAGKPTLIVNPPNGKWVCHGASDATDAQLVFADPDDGRYEIWIAGDTSRVMLSGTLSVTELPD